MLKNTVGFAPTSEPDRLCSLSKTGVAVETDVKDISPLITESSPSVSNELGKLAAKTLLKELN